MKHLKNKGLALSIVDGKEVLIGLIRSNTTIIIKDKVFAELMKKFYINTYKKAPKIKLK